MFAEVVGAYPNQGAEFLKMLERAKSDEHPYDAIVCFERSPRREGLSPIDEQLLDVNKDKLINSFLVQLENSKTEQFDD